MSKDKKEWKCRRYRDRQGEEGVKQQENHWEEMGERREREKQGGKNKRK